MERIIGQMTSNQTRPDTTRHKKTFKIEAEVNLCHDAYDEIGFDAPNIAGEQHTTMVTAMPDTGASMCMVGKCVTTHQISPSNKNRPESMHLHGQQQLGTAQ